MKKKEWLALTLTDDRRDWLVRYGWGVVVSVVIIVLVLAS